MFISSVLGQGGYQFLSHLRKDNYEILERCFKAVLQADDNTLLLHCYFYYIDTVCLSLFIIYLSLYIYYIDMHQFRFLITLYQPIVFVTVVSHQ